MPNRVHDFPDFASKLLTEVAKINGRLDSQDALIKSRLDRQDDIAEELRKDVKAVSHLITGNGTPEKGVVVRLDRIEQGEKRREGWMKACIGACISAVVSTVFALIKRSMTP